MLTRINIPTDISDNSSIVSVLVTCGLNYTNPEKNIRLVRSAKDPVHAGIVEFWTGVIEMQPLFNEIIMVGTCPIHLVKLKSTYKVNGKSMRQLSVCHLFARMTYRAAFEKDPEKLMKSLYANLSMPENIRYCIENRFPYYFYDNYTREDVRLNMIQIGDSEVALEVADGVWGNLSIDVADKICQFYIEGNTRSKYRFLSPESLYKLCLDREPSPSDSKVMREFLKQNRKQDIVDKRAIELVKELEQEYKGKIFVRWEDDFPKSMVIRGKKFDWLLSSGRNDYQSNLQMVSTHIWQPSVTLDENGDTVFGECNWNGPICIDNLAPDSPLGDQYAARALALINDNITIGIVNTIKRYITDGDNENRVDDDELY